jgi:RNA polymerase sigma-70 factor (ECF subfamily)
MLRAMDELVARLAAEGRAAWPDVPLDADVFARLVAPHTREGGSLHAGDLWLACACAEGVPQAIAAFERAFLSQVRLFIARIDPSPELAEEVRQGLRERLLVARAGAPPRIAGYTGRGPLGGWLRVAAVRLALDVRERAGDVARFTDDLASAVAQSDEPEVALLRRRHRADFQAAVEQAIAGLTPKERTLMRLYAADGKTIDELGVAYRVDRSTISRWLANARRRVLAETHRLLGQRLRLSPSELTSLMRAVRSDLHLSLNRLLR